MDILTKLKHQPQEQLLIAVDLLNQLNLDEAEYDEDFTNVVHRCKLIREILRFINEGEVDLRFTDGLAEFLAEVSS